MRFYFWFISTDYYKCHKVNFKRGGSYISSNRIKKKNTAINSKKMHNKCFQYVATVALIYLEIEWNPEGISNVKSFINKYNSRELNLSSKIDDCKAFQKNNPTITFNFLYTKEK